MESEHIQKPSPWAEDIGESQETLHNKPKTPLSAERSADDNNRKGVSDRPKRSRTYSSRTCRICLETVYPSYEPAPNNLSSMFNPSPSVLYISSDPAAGRLIRPCKCRGSSRYVHEGCLQTWRHADPAYGKRYFWQCPTCGFKYRLERMKWAAWINSTGESNIPILYDPSIVEGVPIRSSHIVRQSWESRLTQRAIWRPLYIHILYCFQRRCCDRTRSLFLPSTLFCLPCLLAFVLC